MTKCQDCAFAIKDKIGEGYTCHRCAPVPYYAHVHMTIWPPVPAHECCGDGVPRKQESSVTPPTPPTPPSPSVTSSPSVAPSLPEESTQGEKRKYQKKK